MVQDLEDVVNLEDVVRRMRSVGAVRFRTPDFEVWLDPAWTEKREIEKREAEREVPWYKAIPGDEK